LRTIVLFQPGKYELFFIRKKKRRRLHPWSRLLLDTLDQMMIKRIKPIVGAVVLHLGKWLAPVGRDADCAALFPDETLTSAYNIIPEEPSNGSRAQYYNQDIPYSGTDAGDMAGQWRPQSLRRGLGRDATS
jgi:hypothetical protein